MAADNFPDDVSNANAMEILFHGFMDGLEPQETVENLKRVGATDETAETVQAKYEELKRLRKKWGFE
jgi:hypothetical protein